MAEPDFPPPNDPFGSAQRPPAGPPAPESAPAAPAPAPAPKSAGRGKLLRVALVVLYTASLGAAYVVSRRQKSPENGAGKSASSLLSLNKDKVGWVRIDGVITYGEGSSWDPTGARAWGRRIRAMAKKDEVKALVLEINSPGGSVGATQELYDQIQRVRKEQKKPVVAVFGDVAASGGYYIAAACDKIVSHPGTLTGSIGVIMQGSNMQELMKKIGVSFDPIKSGAHKDIGSPTRPMTAEERAILQSIIDDAYKQFVAAVQEGRKIDAEKLKTLADGRIFTGAQAKEAGLVDELGDTRAALALAGKLGGIEGDPEVYRADEPWEGLLTLLEVRSPFSKLEGAAAEAMTGPRLEYRWTGF